MTPTRSLTEAALLTGISVMLFWSSAIPVMGLLLTLLCPVPMVVLGLRHSLRISLVAMVAATILAGMLGGPFSALSYGLGFGVLGVALARFIRRFRSAVEILLAGLLVSLAGKLLTMVCLLALTGINPFAVDAETMQPMIDQVAALYGDSEAVRRQLQAVVQAIPLLFPAMLIIASAWDCFLGYWLTQRVMDRIGGSQRIPKLPLFRLWRFPRSLLWAYIAAGLCLLMGQNQEGVTLLTRLGLNLKMVVSLFFLAQGLSVVAFFMERQHWGRGLRWAVIAAVFFIPLASEMASTVGILDQWLDLRVRYGGDRP